MHAPFSLTRPSLCAVTVLLSILAFPALAADPPPPSPAGGAEPAPPPPGEGTLTPPGSAPAPQGNTPPAGAAPGGGQTPPKSDAKTLTIDLATAGDFVLDAGTYTAKYIDKIPAASYTPSSKLSNHAIPAALNLPTPAPLRASCVTLANAFMGKLDSVTCESEVSGLRAAIASQLAGGCSDAEIQQVTSDFDKLTTWTDPNPLPALVDGDVLAVTVKRDSFITGAKTLGTSCAKESLTTAADSSGRSAVAARTLGTWTYSVGKLEAQWLTLYGFNFAAGGNQDYFSKTNSGTNPTTYTITRKAGRGGKAFSPSVYFMRLPGEDGATFGRWAGWRQGDYFGGITAGLGFDFDNPTVFLGYGFGWGYNVLATAGVVMHKENRLNGQYNAGDVVSENLTSDQLTQSTYKPQAYIGLAFRFGSNPFKSTNTDTKPKADTTTPPK